MHHLGLLLLAALFVVGTPLKILGYNPIFGHSHANFIGKIADVLAEAGHEVVLLTPVMSSRLKNRTSLHARVIFAKVSQETQEIERKADEESANLWTADNESPIAFLDVAQQMRDSFRTQCEATLSDPFLLERLRSEHFDVAYSESLDLCGFGIFHLLGIRRYATTFSMALLANARWHGAPSFPSYVPGILSSFSDRMTLLERLLNTIEYGVSGWLMGRFVVDTDDVFAERFPEMPSLDAIVANSSFFFVNSEPLIDFPRPVTRKIVDIGGITVPPTSDGVNKFFSNVLSLRRETVVISFGTIMQAYQMPFEHKQIIRELALSMPNVTFIWKYERSEDAIASGISNLITAEWLPQLELLRDGRISAFISHGGAGSTTEATLTGVPLVVVPVMGDQLRNGEMVRRLGNGVIVPLSDFARSGRLERALTKVLTDYRYRNRATWAASMVAAQPESVRHRLVSHVEFMAHFGPLDTLNDAGRELGLIAYYNVDVAAILLSATVLVPALIVAGLYGAARLATRALRFGVKRCPPRLCRGRHYFVTSCKKAEGVAVRNDAADNLLATNKCR